MNSSLGIGRIADIPIGANWSWLVVFGLVLWSLAVTSSRIRTASNPTSPELMDEVAHRHRHSTYPVVENGRAVGLLSFRRLAQTPRREWNERRVRDCMLPRDEVPTVAEDDAAGKAFQRLTQSRVGRALVVDDGRLVGLLTLADLQRRAEHG